MNKTIAIIASAMLALCCTGCGSSISGSVETCVEGAQELSTDDNATIEVTGDGVGVSDGDKKMTIWPTDSNGNTYAVYCYFDEPIENSSKYKLGNRVTVKGKIDPKQTKTGSIVLKDCKIVD